MPNNIHHKTVEGFGEEWSHFDQTELSNEESLRIFEAYFKLFPWNRLPENGGEGLDAGCGSGRWARLVAPRVRRLHCLDASQNALEVAKRNCAHLDNVSFLHASIDKMPVPRDSLDFAYSLGVLHHMPDTASALRDIASTLKPGAPLLVYLYYALDNRPFWFRILWKASNAFRLIISRLPFGARKTVSNLFAFGVYWPLARTARLLERIGRLPNAWPLAEYRDKSFYVMRTDALDRFGTRLEKRFKREEVIGMMQAAGLSEIQVQDAPPYWTAVGIRA